MVSIASIKEKSTNNWFRKPPIQRQKWGDTQCLPHVNWGDLFFDLFYVAAAYNLAYIVKSDPSLLSLLYVLGCFGPLKNIWTLKTMFDAQFQSPDDILHLVMEILSLLFTAAAVLHIRPVKYMSTGASNPEMFLFSLSISLGYLHHILRFAEIRYWGVIGQYSARYAALSTVITILPSFMCAVGATLYSAVVFYSNSSSSNSSDGDDYHRLLAAADDGAYSEKSDETHNTPILLLLAGYLISHVIAYPIRYIRGKGADFKLYSIPLNVEFVIHRNGEWTMLMLGESILSLLIVDVSDEVPEFYVTFFTGVLSVTLLQYLYFKSQPHHADGHAMRRSRSAGFTYAFLINVYSVALIIVGVSFKMLLEEYKYVESNDSTQTSSGSYLLRLLASGGGDSKYSTEDRRQRISYFFCLSLATVFTSLDLMTLCHKGIKQSIDRCSDPEEKTIRFQGVFMIVVMRIAGILFIGTACFFITVPESVALVGLASIVLQVLIRLMGAHYFPSDSHKSHGDEKEGSRTKQDLQPNILDDEVNEGQWPNTTQPMSAQKKVGV